MAGSVQRRVVGVSLLCAAVLFWLLFPLETVEAQNAPLPSVAGPASAGATTMDLYVKVAAAVVTALGTLLGLPVVFLSYRKTRAEIAKLELEAVALREKQASQSGGRKESEGDVHVASSEPSHVNVEVLADPRLLAPLLILLDFVLAWIALTLISRLFSIFKFGPFAQVVLLVLAFALFLPIVRETLRVGMVLRSGQAEGAKQGFMRRVRFAAYALYGIASFAFLLVGGLVLLLEREYLQYEEMIFFGVLVAVGVLALCAAPTAKKRLDRYLARQ